MLAIFPFAGEGRRFTQRGYTLPKPFLPHAGKPLIGWALQSVSLLHPAGYEFLCQDTLTDFPATLIFPEGCWHVLDHPTRSPLHTVLEAQACLDTHQDVLICDCDSFLDPQELAQAVSLFRETKASGGVTIRRTQDPACAYVEVDSEWRVKVAREKEVISPWSCTGPYWFRSGQEFLKAARQALASQEASIAPVYNFLGGVTRAVPVATFQHLGTPEAYETAQEALRHA